MVELDFEIPHVTINTQDLIEQIQSGNQTNAILALKMLELFALLGYYNNSIDKSIIEKITLLKQHLTYVDVDTGRGVFMARILGSENFNQVLLGITEDWSVTYDMLNIEFDYVELIMFIDLSSYDTIEYQQWYNTIQEIITKTRIKNYKDRYQITDASIKKLYDYLKGLVKNNQTIKISINSYYTKINPLLNNKKQYIPTMPVAKNANIIPYPMQQNQPDYTNYYNLQRYDDANIGTFNQRPYQEPDIRTINNRILQPQMMPTPFNNQSPIANYAPKLHDTQPVKPQKTWWQKILGL